MFDNASIDAYFQYVVPKIANMEYKNALCCVLIYFVGIEFISSDKFRFKLNIEKLNFVHLHLLKRKDLIFKEFNVKYQDLIRYIRYFSSISI